MKFKYSAFIENTPEMREWLEKIGYTVLRFFLNGKYLYAKQCTWSSKDRTWKEPYYYTSNDMNSNYIDCRSNPQLFKALTAVREDSDYMQWFVEDVNKEIYEEDWMLCTSVHFPNHEYYDTSFHKANLIELIKHFNL